MKKSLVLALFILISANLVTSKSYHQEIQTEIQLPGSGELNVIRLLDAKNGALAVTSAGAYLYQHEQWTTSVDQQNICSAAMNPAGQLWLGSVGWVSSVKDLQDERLVLPAAARYDSVISMAWSCAESLWVGTTQGLFCCTDGWKEIKQLRGRRVNDILPDKNEIWVATDSGLWLRKNGEWLDVSENVLAPGLGQRYSCLAKPQHGTGILFANPIAVGRISEDGNNWLYSTANGLPYGNIACILESADGIWLGTTRGAIKYADGQWHYYSGRRWLPDDHVNDILRVDPHTMWIATQKGISEIRQLEMTLGQKAAAFEERVQKRHKRHGLVAGSHLHTPGDLDTSVQTPNDNDGLWTSIYLAAECFRYAVTGEKEAYENAVHAFEAMERLETITPIAGFPARSYAKIDEDVGRGGEWHLSSDGKWQWKGDTSSDEIVGHMFAYPIFYDLVAQGEHKQRVRSLVHRIMSHIVDNQFLLVDLDGKPTRWGVWNPDSLNHNPRWRYERGLNSLQILSFLKSAYHVTGDDKFENAYRYLISEHGYAQNMVYQKMAPPFEVNHSDDELAFLPYYCLFRYAEDAELLKLYRQSMEYSWMIDQPEKNPLWNVIASFALKRDCGIADAVETLRLTPISLITWGVTNSHRKDIHFEVVSDRFGNLQSTTVLPIDERGVAKWNSNPYKLDWPGNGRGEDDGAFWLCPYWMGRHHGFVE